MGVATGSKEDTARAAWTLMMRFMLEKGRPRMLELWREFDLMPPQQIVLGLLDEPRPMGELARHMHCDNSNITGLVDRLTERGFVERRPAEGDRRVKLVALTEAGRKVRDELDRRRSEPPEEITDLSIADLERLRRIFSSIAE